MGLVGSLLEVGETIETALAAATGIDAADIRIMAPGEVSSDSLVRVSLLYITPSEFHRNHGLERGSDGIVRPPPPTLQVVYLITTYGDNGVSEHQDAIDYLGQVVQWVHTTPRLTLPADRGRLGITIGPMTPELMDQVFGTIGVDHRPFCLLYVDHVQIEPLLDEVAGGHIVVPGGPRVDAEIMASVPLLARMTPPLTSVGGRIRIDGGWSGLERVWFAGVEVLAGAITELVPGETAVLDVPAPVTEGENRPLSLVAGGIPSDKLRVRVFSSTASVVDAPLVLTHDRTVELELTGRGLEAAENVVFWPDTGVHDPTDVQFLSRDVKEVFPTPPSDTQVFVPTSELSGLEAGRLYRVAAQLTGPIYTAYVLLEFT